MPVVDVAEEFARRIAAARAQDDERFEWMKGFQAQLAELAQNYEDVCNDLKREQIAGRETQRENEKWERRFEELEHAVEVGSFVLVLIDADADAYIFNDDYYRSPTGGRKAAVDIENGVRQYLAKGKPELARLPVMVRAFANADGLAGFLTNLKVIQHSGALWDFAKEFSQAHPLSDFVLVGNGKERVDKKISGVFERFIKNPTCRHVFFGACHDNGYVRMLEDYASSADRITLLHSFAVGKEFQMLPMRTTRLDGVFRTKAPPSPKVAGAIIKQPEVLSKNSESKAPKTWAALAKDGIEPNKIVVSAQIKDRLAGILVNAAGQRVDPQLPQLSNKAIKGWNQKLKCGMRYCRPYQLGSGCQGGCGYSHGPLSDGEKLVYRIALRREYCHTGLACRNVNCFYGHNCSCKQVGCKFPAGMHNVDDTTAAVWSG